MAVTTKELERIRKEGLKALKDKLGVDGMIKFLQLYSGEEGDYTRERRKNIEKLNKKELQDFLREEIE